jgi:hypothetical protein
MNNIFIDIYNPIFQAVAVVVTAVAAVCFAVIVY